MFQNEIVATVKNKFIMKVNAIILYVLVLFCSACTSNHAPLQVHVGYNDTTLLDTPFGMTVDKDGNLYVANAGKNCITKVGKNGEVSVFAGTGEASNIDGAIDTATFNSPSGVCFDNEGNIIVAGFGGGNIRRITIDGQVETLAGTGKEGYTDGPAEQATFSAPRGVCVDSKGNIYVGDCWNHRIRKISPDGIVSTFAGGGKIGVLVKNDWKDGPDTTARFDAPCGLAIDKNDNVYVADAGNHSIRKISPNGYVTTIAGIDKKQGLVDGPITEAELNTPTEVFVDDDLVVYFSDTYNNCIRKIGLNGNIETLIHSDDVATLSNDSTLQPITSTRGICVYKKELYFLEWHSHLMWKFQLNL